MVQRGFQGYSQYEWFLFHCLGRDERFFEKFVVSPNNELLVFLGKDGYMPLVSNKVSFQESSAVSDSSTAWRQSLCLIPVLHGDSHCV